MRDIQKFGYYKVDENIFLNKVQALEYASKNNKTPTWHFNQDAFDQYNWQVEPTETIEEIYKQRALQLREKYDHLVLFYSGGIDSHNILTTFIKNNIKLDAVVIYGTFEFDKEKNSKFNLELYNAAIPFAKQYEHLYDLHLIDISSMYEKYYHADWIYESGVQLSPYEFLMGKIHHEKYINSWLQKDNCGLIRGLDKPRVIFHENKYYVSFLDICVMQTPTAMLSENNPVDNHTELFYWSAECPWLIAKQAHIVKNYFKNQRPDLREMLTHTSKFSYSTLTKYIVPLIYDVGVLPGTDPKYYSLGKTTSLVYHMKDEWFYKPNNLELNSQKLWKQGIDKIDRIVDDRFKNQNSLSIGLSGFWSNWYCLGE